MTVPGYDDFYVALWPRLVRTTYAVSGDLGVAEDAVQTALAKAYRSWRRVSRLDAKVVGLSWCLWGCADPPSTNSPA
jgi:DNA-directed RNA polymerase specialized sigma24 family protein